MNKLLIANRGEIAVRIIRTARKMGIMSVAVYSEADKESYHVSFADEAYCIGNSELSETYLNIPKIISVALETHCEAIHPGYGFLSENPDFVRACHAAGITFVGPDADVMKLMGNKIAARDFAMSAGVPVTMGLTGPPEAILQKSGDIPFPVLVKAAAGGGGKGMRIVHSADELREALAAASREAESYFANGEVYVEQYIENPRHIEFQVLGDRYGNIVHLFERECSIQRRYQKIIEEAPSPTLNPETRRKMGEAAVKLCREAGYSNAGTIEFLVDKNLNFYFLEMNTRIQVEHPVTELTTGVDIVEEQLLIASGHKLRLSQDELFQNGHAIECRIYAEDPAKNFMPSPGEMSSYHEPSGRHIRVDSGIKGKPVIHSYFDPLIAKLITWGESRDDARKLAIEALDNYIVQGIKSNITYLKIILSHDDFIQNRITTRYCDDNPAQLNESMENLKSAISEDILMVGALYATFTSDGEENNATDIWKRVGYWRHLMEPEIEYEGKIYHPELLKFDGEQIKIRFHDEIKEARIRQSTKGRMEVFYQNTHYQIWYSVPAPGKVTLTVNSATFELTRNDLLPGRSLFNPSDSSESMSGSVVSPMPGKVISIHVKEGDTVKKGDLLVIVEAMKMENNILSPVDGVIERINAETGMLVNGNTRLVHFR